MVNMESEGLPHEGYVSKRSKHMPTDSQLNPARHLGKCMIIFNMNVGPVRMQRTNIQKMNNYEMIMQKIPNLLVCSLE